MVDKQRSFAKLLQQGVSISEACRRLGIDRKTLRSKIQRYGLSREES